MDIIGHQKNLKFLDFIVEHNKTSQAYLFFGPRSIGKELVAVDFAMKILTRGCDPAAKAKIEQQVERRIYPDLCWLERPEDKKNILIEQIREIHSFLNLKSFANSYKIVIINNAEELSKAASNSLLKFLEEAPAKIIIILIAHNLKKILPTILSRCQLFKFNPVPLKEIKEFLVKNLQLKELEAQNLAQLSFGRPGMAMNLLKSKELRVNYNEEVKTFLQLIDQPLAARLDFVGSLTAPPFFSWEVVLRDILLSKNNLSVINSALEARIKKVRDQWSEEKLLRVIKAISRAKNLLKHNINKKLILENLFISF
ncbi:MAG: DNA polymerase III subunit [Candidatus Parcubacteria bacterium]|nr:DNA polymerase III subunit [Candidatus Parcubacteria bacterium]